MMKSELKLFDVSIKNVLDIVDGLSMELLNEIPKGYSNNLLWNVGHLLVTQKLLIYALSHNPMHLSRSIVESYRKGSKPTGIVTKADYDELLNLFKSQYSVFVTDINNDIFQNFDNYMTSYNFEITDLGDATSFNNSHYAIHIVTMQKMRTLLI